MRIEIEEAAMDIAGESCVTAFDGERLFGVRCDAEIEDRIHHAGHRDRCTGAYRNQQRPIALAKAAPGTLFQVGHTVEYLGFQFGRKRAVRQKRPAGFSGDDESRRRRQPKRHHARDRPGLATDERPFRQHAAVQTDHPLSVGSHAPNPIRHVRGQAHEEGLRAARTTRYDSWRCGRR